VAELVQLHFYSLEISFCIQTFWSHSLQIIVNSAMASHGAVSSSYEHTVLYSVFILYALHIMLYYTTFCLITLRIMFRLNTGRSYRGPNVVLSLNFKSSAGVNCDPEVRSGGRVIGRHCIPFL